MIEGKRRRGRRCRHILEDLKEKRGYWKLKEETLDRTLCELVWKRLGPVARQAADWTNVTSWFSKFVIQIFRGFRLGCLDLLNISIVSYAFCLVNI